VRFRANSSEYDIDSVMLATMIIIRATHVSTRTQRHKRQQHNIILSLAVCGSAELLPFIIIIIVVVCTRRARLGVDGLFDVCRGGVEKK